MVKLFENNNIKGIEWTYKIRTKFNFDQHS